jgi:ligand-binding sensor domain-containing protein/signal transduction histidine kinase/DNA-binding response OmpR family regulator
LNLLPVVAVDAQQAQLSFKHYTINEGLSQNTVYCLLEDKDGLIWMGTEDGLNKFDGYDFTQYKHDFRYSNSVSHNQINTLYEDREGRIWVGTSDGLNIFDKKTEKFTRLKTIQNPSITSNDFITSVYQDRKGNIWVTSLDGLKLYNPATKTFSVYNDTTKKRTDRIMEDAQGILWVSINRDLKRFDPVKKIFLPLPDVLEHNSFLRNSFIRVIKRDSAGKIWIGTETSGLFVYDETANTLQQFRNEKSDKNSLAADIVREIFFPDKNNTWIGTRNGLSVYNRNTGKFTNYRNDRYDRNSLSGNSIRTILKDRAGNIWLGTFGGGINLMATSHNMFNYLGAQTPGKPGLSFEMVSSVVAANKDALWIGTEGGGLNYADLNTPYFKKYALSQISANIGANTIKCILPEGEDLWLGTVKGLYYYDHSTQSLKNIPIPINNKEIFSMAKTKDNLWLATNGSGLISMDKKGRTTSYKMKPSENSITHNEVTKIIKDDADNLWIGTNKGLSYFNGGKFTQFYHEENNAYSLSNNTISTLLIDAKKRIWIGTKGGGINLYDKTSNRFYVIDKKSGLSNDVIQSIEEDNNGNIWVSTNQGLSKIIISGAPPFTQISVRVSNYFVEDGLQSNQFLPNSSFKNERGELFYGGINGLTYFNPENIKRNPYLPPVVFTEFLIRNMPIEQYSDKSVLQQAINETKEITLTYDQVFISFRFAALNYVNPGKNKYAYKLEGFEHDDDWHYVDGQREATYTNLGAGTYIFKVKAANNDGLWNDTPKTIKIIVLPPWWKTWWAYTLYALIIATVLYLYISYSLRTAKLKNDLAFEHLIRKKDNELYQRKLNFFTNISHEIKTPLTLILAPIEKLLGMSQENNRVQNTLTLMRNNGEKLMRLVNELLDFRKFDSGNMELQAAEGNMVSFIKEIVAAFEEYAKDLNVTIRVESDKKNMKAWFDRDKFEKIIYNLISNALKFTKPGGNIIIRVQQQMQEETGKDDFIIIEVEDNGIGISEDKIATIFEPFTSYDKEESNLHGTGIGLAFTKGLVELHHGQITAESIPAKEGQEGKTYFAITMPAGHAHLLPGEIAQDVQDGENISAYAVKNEINSRSVSMEKRIENVLSDMEDVPVMLIAEDNKDVMAFLVENFKDKFRIETANNGREGIDKAISAIPDIILSDVMMPEISGTVLCSTLKTDNRTSHIPVILLTARSQIVNMLEGLETGADDYITKPFSIRILEAKVWNLMEQRQLLRERYRKEITLLPKNISISSPDEAFLTKVMAYIETNITEPALNVEDLAKEVFMSRTTLYRKIKALTNQTTIEFIRTVKLKRAAQLLESKSYNINEVAYMSGFNDIDYFRKCFKEQYHKTPTGFINSKE